MRFKITVESNNYAFVDQEAAPDLVLGGVVAEVAKLIADGFGSGTLRDPVNGQPVGTWEYAPGVTE